MYKQKKSQILKFPIRVNHFMALQNYCSRREADGFVKQGFVKINGKTANVGDRVFKDDKVEFSKTGKSRVLRYFIYNKPKGIITHSPQGTQQSIKETAKFPKDVFPVGRLDLDSRGLIIMTNDGRITAPLLDPEYEHEKEYRVIADKNLTGTFLKRMQLGVRLVGGGESYMTKPCKIKIVNERSFDIILTEGKKHQIRRMCSALNYQVRDLVRTRIMGLKLGSLKAGESREVVGAELKNFLKDMGF